MKDHKKEDKTQAYEIHEVKRPIFNRPGVAEVVLQTPLVLRD